MLAEIFSNFVAKSILVKIASHYIIPHWLHSSKETQQSHVELD